MGRPTSLSSPFSPTRPSKLLLDESSLSEAQAKLRLSPKRFHFYASDESDGALENHYEVANPRPFQGIDDTKLLGSPAGSNFRRPFKTEVGLDESDITSVMARPPKDDTDDDSSCGGRSFNSILDTWKPRKPRKPSFLTAPKSSNFDSTSNSPGNVQYTGVSPGWGKNEEETGQAVQGPPSSPPPKVSKPPRIRLSVNRPKLPKVNPIPRDHLGKPQNTTRKIIWRQYLQSTLYRNPEKPLFKLPLDDPERPFPFPIPTMDKLPLLPECTACQPVEAKEQAGNVDSIDGLFAHFKEKLIVWIKSRKVALISLSLYGNGRLAQMQLLSSSESKSYVCCLGTRWSVIPIGNVASYSQVVPGLPMEETVNLLQINIVMPALVLHVIGLIGAAIQHPKLPILLPMVARFVKTLFSFIMLAILLAFKEIRLSITSRQNQSGNRVER